MATEIERKFLVSEIDWSKICSDQVDIIQHYIVRSKEVTLRVRQEGSVFILCVKGNTSGFSRPEFEYEITESDFISMSQLHSNVKSIEKTRYKILHSGLTWEVDVFHGDNQGLTVAEVEMPSEDFVFDTPDWVRSEVSDNPNFLNSRLCDYPFKDWKPFSDFNLTE